MFSPLTVVNVKAQVEMEPPGDPEGLSAWPASVDMWHEGAINTHGHTGGCVYVCGSVC